jgi:hypothetical protein
VCEIENVAAARWASSPAFNSVVDTLRRMVLTCWRILASSPIGWLHPRDRIPEISALWFDALDFCILSLLMVRI